MKNDFEHINKFLKDEIGNLEVDPGKQVKKRLERKLSYLNFFRYQWNRINIYYVSVAILVSLYFFVNFNHQNMIENNELLNLKDSTTMETNKNEFIKLLDSTFILQYAKNNDSLNNENLFRDNEKNVKIKTEAAGTISHKDSVHHTLNNKIKGQKLNAVQRKKDTVKVVINDTVYKRVKVQVVDTIK
ncbi:MAG: hypothetical protein ACOC2U_05620 [bacterium]